MPDYLKLVRQTAFLAGLLISATALCGADALQTERISAAYILAAGHLPTAEEVAALRDNTAAPVAKLVTDLSQSLAADPAKRAQIAQQAYVDCFGVEPAADQLDRVKGNYADQLKQRLQGLAAQRDEYAKVLQRAYQRVIRRDAYAEEIAYWNKYDVVPYALLSAAIENWARRNQPGLMVTSGDPTVSVNSLYLSAVQLPPVLADEVADALGSPRMQDDVYRVRSPGRTVLTPGGGQLISNGAIAFVAAGKSAE